MSEFYIAASAKYERVHRMRVIRRNLRDETNPFEIPEARFIELFRLPKARAKALVDEIMVHMVEKKRSDAIPAQLRILATLNFYASGSYQRSCNQDFMQSMSQTVISQSIKEVSDIFCSKLAAKYIVFPKTRTELLNVKQGFLELHSDEIYFPDVIGCISCGHIPLMVLPTINKQYYINRKSSQSKNVQFICDANLKMINVFARFSGSTHDAYIWSISQIRFGLKKKYDDGLRHFWLLGDSVYPLEPWLMTPYKPAKTSTERIFNHCHAIKRNTIQRAIGLLKSRFRCCSIEKPLRYSPAAAGAVINSCVVLHNILVDIKHPISAEEERLINLEMQVQPTVQDSDNSDEETSDFESDINLLNKAERTRNCLADTLNNQNIF